MHEKEKNLITKPLTEVEFEVMNVIWGLGRCTIKEVQTCLSLETREMAYTTVATMIKILEQKKFLRSEKSDRTHAFIPLISREEYEKIGLNHLTQNLFRGDSLAMIMKLLDDSDLSAEELKKIRKLVESRIKK